MVGGQRGASICCDQQETSTIAVKPLLYWDSGYWSVGAKEPAVVNEISITEVQSGRRFLRLSIQKIWSTGAKAASQAGCLSYN